MLKKAKDIADQKKEEIKKIIAVIFERYKPGINFWVHRFVLC